MIDEVPSPFRNYTHQSWSTLAELKHERAWQTFGDFANKSRSWEHPGSEGPVGGWSIPMKFLVEQPVQSTHLLEEWSKDLENCKATFTYQYGGQVHENKWMSQDQVNQGNVRDWAWFLLICSKELLKKFEKMFPVEEGGGFSPNHYLISQGDSSDYIAGQWGVQNYIYLLGIKQMYDPFNLFGCRMCVAWPPSLKNYTAFITNPMYLENSLHMYAPDPFLDSMKKEWHDAHSYKN